MEASKLKKILNQHKLWLAGKGGKRADLTGANLSGANLSGVILTGANLTGANLTGANLFDTYLKDTNLKHTIGLPDISWIEPGRLVQLKKMTYDFYLFKEHKWVNFIQGSIGMVIQNNSEQATFDLLVGDRIIRDIPNWLKYSAIKKIE